MAYDFKNIAVLIVDSQPAMVELIRDVLQMFGVQKIITRTEGKSGLRAFEEHMPDLIIIDWDLADLDGIEFTKAVRRSPNDPYVPIIFMAALSSQKRVAEARDSGITEFLRKPFTAQALYKHIETIVERPRPFVRVPDFFGPDRRRRQDSSYDGVDKRANRNPDDPYKPRKK